VKTVKEGHDILGEIRRLTEVADGALRDLSGEASGSDPNPAIQAALDQRRKTREAADAGVAQAAVQQIGDLVRGIDGFVAAETPPAAPAEPTPPPAAPTPVNG